MREKQIKIQPFEELRVEDYRGMKQVNEHACAEMEGIIPFGKKEEYISLCSQETWAQVVVSDENKEYILFYGIVENARMEVVNGLCKMKLTLRSGTILLDDKERIRSFQSTALLYKDLLNICNMEYDNAGVTMTEGQGTPTGQFVMQYKETDWGFIKRLASMNNTVVVADYSRKGERYYFGLPERNETIDGDQIEYRIQGDMEEYWKKKEKG